MAPHETYGPPRDEFAAGNARATMMSGAIPGTDRNAPAELPSAFYELFPQHEPPTDVYPAVAPPAVTGAGDVPMSISIRRNESIIPSDISVWVVSRSAPALYSAANEKQGSALESMGDSGGARCER